MSGANRQSSTTPRHTCLSLLLGCLTICAAQAYGQAGAGAGHGQQAHCWTSGWAIGWQNARAVRAPRATSGTFALRNRPGCPPSLHPPARPPAPEQPPPGLNHVGVGLPRTGKGSVPCKRGMSQRNPPNRPNGRTAPPQGQQNADRQACMRREEGGVWNPNFCVPKIAQINISFCKFLFFPL